MAGGGSVPAVSAWGGVFNRFTPELLGNLGYSGGGSSNNALFYEVGTASGRVALRQRDCTEQMQRALYDTQLLQLQ